MRLLILSCSLNPHSRSAVLATELNSRLRASLNDADEIEHIDLRETPLPPCDGHTAYDDDHVRAMSKAVTLADAIILAVPIYNYDVNAAAKNLVELTGRAWTDKIVGFLCAAGGKGSYMSIMALANSLMLDFRCVIIPRFVYATGEDFDDGRLDSPVIRERLDELTEKVITMTRGLTEIA